MWWFPWWWAFWGFGSAAKPQVVAVGETTLDADGTFRVAFTPEADEAKADSKETTWRYVVQADVLDEGGETRSATRAVRLGFVADVVAVVVE